MSGWTTLFLAIGTLGVEHGVERRWPRHAWTARYTCCLVWAGIWWATNANPYSVGLAFAGAALVLIAELGRPRPARPHRTRPAQHHRVGQHTPYSTARPLRRLP